MTLLQAITLSIVEGITEFLPVSSTGHLIITGHLLGIAHTTFVSTFDIVIQLGAIGAAILLYTQKIFKNRGLFLKLCVAFLPSAIIGLTLYGFIKEVLLASVYITSVALVVGGLIFIVFYFLDRKKAEEKDLDVSLITYKQAFLIGCAQVIAMIPGVSRSGATIIGGVSAGLSRKQAIEFSFMLAIPTMLAASGLDLVQSGFSFSSEEWMLLSVGFFAAFVSAFFVMKFLLSLLYHRAFLWFGIYRIVLGLLLLIFI